MPNACGYFSVRALKVWERIGVHKRQASWRFMLVDTHPDPEVLTTALRKRGPSKGLGSPCKSPLLKTIFESSLHEVISSPPPPSPQLEERQYSGSGPFDVLIFIHCHASISGPQALQKQFQSCKNDSNLMEILVLIQVWWTLLICIIMSFSKTELKRCLHLTINGSSGWTCGIAGDRRKSSPLPLPLPAPFSLPFCNEYALFF